MAGLQTLDTHAYEVLGVSPNASPKEIDDAFHRLIEKGGYRNGVPLRDQWQRAREIKEAYATLRNPPQRRAYDESLKVATERPLWPAASAYNHPAEAGEAGMVQPLGEGQPPPEPTPQSTTAAMSLSDGEPDPAPAEAVETGNDEIVPSADQHVTSPEDDSSRIDVKHGSAKLWGSAAAVTLALGSLFYFTWPSGDPQLPSTETAAQPPAGQPQVNSGAPTTGRLAKLSPAVEPDGLSGKVRTEGPGETLPVPEGIANEAQTQPGAAAVSGGKAASSTEPPIAPNSSGQSSTAAEAAAAAAPTPAPLPPRAQTPTVVLPGPAAALPQVHTSVAVQPRTSEVHSPPQLIGGGPTHLDNRRGRHVGSVIVQFTVRPDGRVSNCGPVRGSGNADLDALTCRLVEERMRFKPALDAKGTPVASMAHARYEWGRRRRHPSLMSWLFR